VLFFYVEGLLAEAEKLCQPCLGIELHGANETSKHTPKRAHPWGGEGRGGEGMEFFIFFLFPSYSHGNLDFLVSEKINIFQVPQGSQKYRSML
jgi:hypothetical protein